MPIAEKIKTMNTPEVRAANKLLAKTLAKKIVVGILVSVAVTLATNAIVSKIEGPSEDIEPLEEA